METRTPPQPQHIVIRISLTRATALLILTLVGILAFLTYSLQPERPKTRTQTHTANWDLVPNGNFEEETTNWPKQLPEQKGKFCRSTDIAVDGIYSMKTIPGSHNEGYANISEPIPTEIGTTYVLSAYFHTQHYTTGNLYLDLADTHNGFTVRAANTKPGWQFKYATFTANAKSVRIRLISDGHIRSTDYAYIDCVALTPAAEFRP